MRSFRTLFSGHSHPHFDLIMEGLVDETIFSTTVFKICCHEMVKKKKRVKYYMTFLLLWIHFWIKYLSFLIHMNHFSFCTNKQSGKKGGRFVWAMLAEPPTNP